VFSPQRSTKEIDVTTYDESEAYGRDRQETDGTPTLAQWARAEALKAVMSHPAGATRPAGMREIENQVNILAELIVTGSLPKPPPGVMY
jgi:hypothetical protein